MSRPRLLDLFCGAGGASMGYHRAGFDVVGVDIEPHPDYPFGLIVADALEAVGDHAFLSMFDAVAASPPCHRYVQWQNLNAKRYGRRVDHPDLIPPTRAALIASGLPFVIENVVGSPLRSPVTLCGSMFGLGVRRHRLFESSEFLWGSLPCRHTGDEIAVYGKLDGRRVWTRVDGSEVRAARTLEQAQAAMGIDWMDWADLREAIPPAYTEYLGAQLIDALRAVA